MTQISLRLVAILFLLGFATSQLFSYDPTLNSATDEVLSQEADQYKWLYLRTIGSNYNFESIRFNPKTTGNYDKVVFTSTTLKRARAVSRGYTCALLDN